MRMCSAEKCCLKERFRVLLRTLRAGSAIDVHIFWRVHLSTIIDKALHRMSPVAFTLNTYMAEGLGSNLVQLAWMLIECTIQSLTVALRALRIIARQHPLHRAEKQCVKFRLSVGQI